MGRHRKRHVFKVLLNDEDDRDVRDLAARERRERKDDELGGATLLREHGMPGIRARLAELKAAEQSAQPAGV